MYTGEMEIPETTLYRVSDREVGWEDTSEVIDLLKRLGPDTEYEPRVIPKEWIGQVLAAGRWTPSLYNAQPWYFIVVADRAAHRALQDSVWTAVKKFRRQRFWKALFDRRLRDPQLKAGLKKIKGPQDVVFDHTVVILGCMDSAQPCAVAATAAALNNMAMEAKRLGMGCASCDAARYLDLLKNIREELGVPAGYRFFGGLMVGFAKRSAKIVFAGRKEVTEISHWI